MAKQNVMDSKPCNYYHGTGYERVSLQWRQLAYDNISHSLIWFLSHGKGFLWCSLKWIRCHGYISVTPVILVVWLHAPNYYFLFHWIKQLLKYNSWSGVMPAYLM
jgi:hypothetical protein